ncbi:hypothetical protein LEMLEM_LOCUS6107 [Lemmus lemmus]
MHMRGEREACGAEPFGHESPRGSQLCSEMPFSTTMRSI